MSVSADAAEARPERMPDACDACRDLDDWSIYYPFTWSEGRARYACGRSHRWTCSWDLAGAGSDEQWAGKPAQVRLVCHVCHGAGGEWLEEDAIERWHDCRACGCSGDELGGEG